MHGKIVALTGATCDQIDGNGRQWIEVMPTATKVVNGPWKFTITAEDLEVFKESIEAQGDRLSVDYDHSYQEGRGTKAAGWFTGQAEIRSTDAGPRLWAQVQWTPGALDAIKAGEYRFISPEWRMESKDRNGWWTRAKSFAAATLTNRPFFKELAAVGEDEPGGEAATTEGEDMPLKELAAALGLPETATAEEITAAVAAAKATADKATELETENATLKASAVPDDVDLEALQAAAKDGTDAKEELRVTRRDNLIAEAIRDRKIDPAEKDRYVKLYDEAPASTTELIASLKSGKLGAIGSEREADEGAVITLSGKHGDLSGSRVPETITIAGSEYPVDEDSSKVHVAALEVLEQNGKRLDHTADEYEAACLIAAEKLSIRV